MKFDDNFEAPELEEDLDSPTAAQYQLKSLTGFSGAKEGVEKQVDSGRIVEELGPPPENPIDPDLVFKDGDASARDMSGGAALMNESFGSPIKQEAAHNDVS